MNDTKDIERPASVGWYLAWISRQEAMAAERKPVVIYCYPEDTDIYCECRDGNDPVFRPVSDQFFRGARWRGPFLSRRAAEEALASAA